MAVQIFAMKRMGLVKKGSITHSHYHTACALLSYTISINIFCISKEELSFYESNSRYVTFANQYFWKNEGPVDLLCKVKFLVSVIYSFNDVIQVAAVSTYRIVGVNLYGLAVCTVCNIHRDTFLYKSPCKVLLVLRY